MKIVKFLFIVMIFTFIISSGCSEKNPADPTPVVTSVVVSPSNVSVARGQYHQFSAEVIGSNNPVQTVIWAVDGGVQGTIISSIGLLRVDENDTRETLTVRATSTENEEISGSVTVAVSDIIQVTIEPNYKKVSVVKGDTFQFTSEVEVVENKTAPQTVSWTVTGGISGTSISATGLLDLSSSEVADSLWVTATSTVDPLKSATVTINVLTIGQAGGYVFYDKGYYSDGWRYLEAAPGSFEISKAWGLLGVSCPGTDTAIGSGRENTQAIIRFLAENIVGIDEDNEPIIGETDRAAQYCDALVIGEYDDWFLPSRDELEEMYKKLKTSGNSVGGFVTTGQWPAGYYWSSSVKYDFNLDYDGRYITYCQDFRSGNIDYSSLSLHTRMGQLSVRPIRAF